VECDEVSNSYIDKLKSFLEGHAQPEYAGAMSKYMRDQFAYLGIRAPALQQLLQQFLKENGLPDASSLAKAIGELWRLPEREYQYAGLTLLSKSRKNPPPERIELIEFLITGKSWWDTVDSLAANDAGMYLANYPERIQAYTEKWMESGNFWLQRSAILFQLKYKSKTDAELLFNYVGRLAMEKEFFIRKAIGWALREYSKTDPDAVQQYVSEYPLSPLSAKEAMKWLHSRK
jgi:3-methyladenine DNA glycosylase AlkD